jgi:DNA polymerase III epsilon subunit-like protein
MTICFVDTETTGIDVNTSAAFEIALFIYQGSQCVFEEVYYLNPLNDGIKWSEGAYKINGVSEETILSYPPCEGVVPDIVADIKKYMPPEKYVFAGYKCGFDYSHIEALFTRCGFEMSDYFNGKMIDVLELVRRAADRGLLPKTDDQKLETMTKALGIVHDESHSAKSDILATRRLYETIYQISRKGDTQ